MHNHEQQVRALTTEISQLSANLNDQSSRQALAEKVSERKNHLREIKTHDFERYKALAKELGAVA